jgi:hypothetical protein
MQKFNLIVLSLLFILSVTAAAPDADPLDQQIAKCRSSLDARGYVWMYCPKVSVDLIYTRRLEPTEPLALTSIIHLNANYTIVPVARCWEIIYSLIDICQTFHHLQISLLS